MGDVNLSETNNEFLDLLSNTRNSISRNIATMFDSEKNFAIIKFNLKNLTSEEMIGVVEDKGIVCTSAAEGNAQGDHYFVFGKEVALAIAQTAKLDVRDVTDDGLISFIQEFAASFDNAIVGSIVLKDISFSRPVAKVYEAIEEEIAEGKYVAIECSLNIKAGGFSFFTIYEEHLISSILENSKAREDLNSKGFKEYERESEDDKLDLSQITNDIKNLDLLLDIYVDLTVELGRTKKQIQDILAMGEGTIIELDKLADEPVDILINKKLVAKGEVIIIDENYGVRITEIISPRQVENIVLNNLEGAEE